MDSRRVKQTRIVKLLGLPEILPRSNGSARVIDATVKPVPRVRRARQSPPTIAVTTATASRSSTPNLVHPDRDPFDGRRSRRRATSASPAPVAPSPYTEPVLMENFKCLQQQLQVIHEQLESVLKICNEQQLSSVSSTHSQYRYTHPPPLSPSPQPPPEPMHKPAHRAKAQPQSRISPPLKYPSQYQNFTEIDPKPLKTHQYSRPPRPCNHHSEAQQNFQQHPPIYKHSHLSPTHQHTQTQQQQYSSYQHSHFQPPVSPPLSPSPLLKYMHQPKEQMKHQTRHTEPEPLADVSFASRDYLRRNNLID